MYSEEECTVKCIKTFLEEHTHWFVICAMYSNVYVNIVKTSCKLRLTLYITVGAHA